MKDLPKKQLTQIIKNILGLLSKDGSFVCDECDNSKVTFKPTMNGQTTAPYQLATQRWLKLSKAMMEKLGNDLELTPEKSELWTQ